MNNALLTLAFIFMFNPAINVVDPLPDFIGWFLLFIALQRVRHISIQMENAAGSAIKMGWLTFAGFVCIFLSPHLDGTMILTITFAVNVMKLIWGIPAFKHFFDGINELAGLYDGKSMYKPLGRSKKEGIQTVERFTYIFLVSFCVLNTLPEFLELSGQTSLILSEGARTWLSFKPIMYAFSFTSELVIGIIWLSLILPFAKRVTSEKNFTERLNEAYKNKVIDTGKHRAITLMGAVFLATIAGLFVLCVMLDDMNIIPRFLMPLLMLFASLLFGKCGYNTKKLSFTAVLATIASLSAYVMRLTFVIKFSYDSVKRSFETYDFYVMTLFTLLFELLLLIVMHVLFTNLIIKVAANDSGREILSMDPEKIAEMRAADQKTHKRRALISLFLFIITCTMNVSSFIICHEMPSSWIAVTLISLIWFVYTYSFYSNLRELIERKYM